MILPCVVFFSSNMKAKYFLVLKQRCNPFELSCIGIVSFIKYAFITCSWISLCL